jgi:hypothetical protein
MTHKLKFYFIIFRALNIFPIKFPIKNFIYNKSVNYFIPIASGLAYKHFFIDETDTTTDIAINTSLTTAMFSLIAYLTYSIKSLYKLSTNQGDYDYINIKDLKRSAKRSSLYALSIIIPIIFKKIKDKIQEKRKVQKKIALFQEYISKNILIEIPQNEINFINNKEQKQDNAKKIEIKFKPP